jgi:predicted metalloprotease with PDZ domain
MLKMWVCAAGCAFYSWAAAAGGDLRYVFDCSHAAEHEILGTITFAAGGRSQTMLSLPNEWDGQTELYRNIQDLESATAGVTLEADGNAAERIVRHPKSGNIQLTFHLVSDMGDKPIRETQFNRPLIRSGYIYLLANSALPIPQLGNSPKSVEVDWRGTLSGWKMVGSFGTGLSQHGEATMEKFMSSTFYGGDLVLRASGKGGAQITVAVPKGAGFEIGPLSDMVQSIAGEERRVWRCEPTTHFAVLVVPIDDVPGNFGGEARTNTLSLYVSRRLEKPAITGHLIAHEMFHLWNPQRLGDFSDGKYYWFSEGFTDLYASLVLLRLKIWSLEDFLESVNGVARSYFTSEYRNATIERVIADRDNKEDASRLPYSQGEVIGAVWNERIFERSGGRHTLDDAMRAMLADKGASLDTSKIVAGILAVGGGDVSSDIQRDIWQGDTIDVPQAVFGPAVEVKHDLVALFNPGFDLDSLGQTHVFNHVDKNSAAYAAGLRDGQQWVGGGITRTPDTRTDFIVEDGSGRHQVFYYPASKEKIEVPTFSLKPGEPGRGETLKLLGVAAS